MSTEQRGDHRVVSAAGVEQWNGQVLHILSPKTEPRNVYLRQRVQVRLCDQRPFRRSRRAGCVEQKGGLVPLNRHRVHYFLQIGDSKLSRVPDSDVMQLS